MVIEIPIATHAHAQKIHPCIAIIRASGLRCAYIPLSNELEGLLGLQISGFVCVPVFAVYKDFCLRRSQLDAAILACFSDCRESGAQARADITTHCSCSDKTGRKREVL